MNDRIDVLGIGNAIVDVLARAEDSFLAARGLEKGTMHLVDAGEADALYAAIGPAVEISGGSAANTIAGLVIHESRSIPTQGQVFAFHGFRFEVLERKANRITRLKIRPL